MINAATATATPPTTTTTTSHFETMHQKTDDDDHAKVPFAIATPVSADDSSLTTTTTTTMTTTMSTESIHHDVIIKEDTVMLYVNQDIIREELGYGPCRFAIDTNQQRSVYEQLDDVTMEERMCYDNIKCYWEEKYPALPTIDWYLRFAICYRYQQKRAWKAMIHFLHHYSHVLQLKISSIERQIWTKTVFPLPALKTSGGHDILYLRLSRVNPQTLSIDTLMDSILYVVNAMLEKEQSCQEGIGILVNMKDWSSQKSSYQYFSQFLMKIIRGTVPVRLRSIILLYPPTWFTNKLWLLRPIISKEMKDKIVLVHHENELAPYLMPCYQRYLPDDICSSSYGGSTQNTDDMVRDYIMYRRYMENVRRLSHQHDHIEQHQQQQHNHKKNHIITRSVVLSTSSSSAAVVMIPSDRQQQERHHHQHSTLRYTPKHNNKRIVPINHKTIMPITTTSSSSLAFIPSSTTTMMVAKSINSNYNNNNNANHRDHGLSNKVADRMDERVSFGELVEL